MEKSVDLLAERLAAEVSQERLMGTVRYMTENFPYRLAGSPCEAAAAQYVTERMRELGMEVECEEFYTYNSNPMESAVRIVEPVQEAISSLPCAHIRATSPEGEDFELVYVGDGSREAYQGKNVRGKMVLVEVSYAPPVPEKACIATEMGAAGIMCMNWGNDEEVICHRALKSVWGNPTERSFPQIPDLVGVGVTRLEGLKLRGLCQRGKVVVHVTAIADRTWSKVHQPHGIIRGNGASDEFLLLASHLDAWQPGVTCNATGNATALELCRLLAAHRGELSRDVHVVFWNGHEIAEAAGSTWFVDHHWDLLNRQCIAYIHVDSTGVSQTEVLEIKISDELAEFARESVKGQGGSQGGKSCASRTADLPEEKLRLLPLAKIGDMSMMGIGIPALCQRIAFSEEAMRKANGATLGWWNHTKEDGLDKCDPNTLREDTIIHARFIARLLNSPVLPYSFEKKLSRFGERIDQLALTYESHLDLSDVQRSVAETASLLAAVEKCGSGLRVAESEDLEKAAESKDLGKAAERVRLYNDCMKVASRNLTNIFQTYAEKYDQDRYGYCKLSRPVPLLADLERLTNMDPASLEYGLIETQLVRNKNRILDGLKTVCDFARLTLRGLED